jgi:hypothetical protein
MLQGCYGVGLDDWRGRGAGPCCGVTVGVDLRPVGGRDLRRLGKRLVMRRAGEPGDGVGAGRSATQLAVASVVDTFAGDLDVALALELRDAAMMENRVETGESGARGEEHREQEDGPDPEPLVTDHGMKIGGRWTGGQADEMR